MKIEEIINGKLSDIERVKYLTKKGIYVPTWGGKNGLIEAYDTEKHPVMDITNYPDEVTDDGIVYVSRVALDFPRLAVKRMTELVCGIPIKRVYKPKNIRQKEIAEYMEAIFDRNRIDSVNVERLNMLFGGCEVITLWFAVEQANSNYGFNSSVKLRCRNFTPMQGDELYPLFDEYGDMVALSIGYSRKVDQKDVKYLDTYTAYKHLKFSNASGEWAEELNENITLGKIPAIYAFRPTPIWENTAKMVYEMEWALSRNGNYLRKNSKPMFVVFADEVIQYGDEKNENKEFRSVAQFPAGTKAQYVTWQQPTENLKYYIDSLKSLFFTQLQLPDWSYEKMSQQALSGESRKQLFIDAQMKVHDESGRLLDFFFREVNVVKAFLKQMLPDEYSKDIDALSVESKITPFSITDQKETVDLLMAANGGEPIMSQRESIEAYGNSDNVDQTLKEIAEQQMQDAMSLHQ